MWLRLHVALTCFLCYLVFLLQNMCKCSVAENGVIDSPRNHQAVYRQLTWTWTCKKKKKLNKKKKKINHTTVQIETVNWCFLRQGEKIQVIVVRIKYSHALAAIVTHSSIHFLIACLSCWHVSVKILDQTNMRYVRCISSLTFDRSSENTLWN